MLKNIGRPFLVLLVSIFLFCAPALADKGVFNANVIPNETFIDTPTPVKITAEVGSENLYISSVMAYLTDENSRPITCLGKMYDDGTHGDETEADTVFTLEVEVNQPAESKLYYVVSAAYYRERNRYMSPVMEFNILEPIPDEVIEALKSEMEVIEDTFAAKLSSNDVEIALQETLEEVKDNPDISSAFINKNNISIIYKDKVRALITLEDPSWEAMKGAGTATPSSLPNNAQFPGSDKILLFAPEYTDSGFTANSEHAKTRFNYAVFMTFDPKPPTILKDTAASLEEIKKWGDYGFVLIDTHGSVFDTDTDGDGVDDAQHVVLRSGTIWRNNPTNRATYSIDEAAGRLGFSNSGKYVIFPSFITEHCSFMKNTLFYLGACDSMKNPTMWNALKAKGAKVAFGWDESVGATFDENTFEELINAMVPVDETEDPLTAKEAYDNIDDKQDNPWWWPWTGAYFTMEVDSADWENYIFVEGGLVNGDFETGDWTGWTTGGNYDFRIISGARKHDGSNSAALGRWDTGFHGYDPTSEPYGYEWMYQDFVVPNNVTYLKFHWWMETYDTAAWDWFDAYIKDTCYVARPMA